MTATAVVVLGALARDEFERDWHGFEEPFSFLDGDGEDQEPVNEFTTVIDGVPYSLPARQVAEVLIGQLANFRDEVEEEQQQEENFSYLSDEEIDERARALLDQYWVDQLDNLAEHLAVIDVKAHWVVEAWKALVATFAMIGERMPELKPVLAEKLQHLCDDLVGMLASHQIGESQ